MKSASLPSIAMCLAAALPAGAAYSQGVQNRLSPEISTRVAAIPGVVGGNVRWELAWSGDGNADGIVGTPDGGLLFAQEQSSRVRKLDVDGNVTTFLGNTNGAGSVSVDADGRVFAVQRTCTDPGRAPELGPCEDPTKVAVLAPEPRVLAEGFADGASLGRVNDLVVDGRGGAFFTSGGLHHAGADGRVRTLAADVRANGVILSPDDATLYVTNRGTIVAFDVGAGGAVSNRRDFARLEDSDGGDGMAVDAAGRLYVTAGYTIQVFSPEGAFLGTIPTPRRAISVAFSGPEKKTLYVVGSGAQGPDGRDRVTPEGVRNNAKSIYRLPMIAEGFAGRPK